MQDQFIFDLDSMDDDDKIKDDVVEMKASNKIKMELHLMQLYFFWCAQHNTFLQSQKSALEILMPFATTYLCETGLPTPLNIKTKVRNCLDPSDDMHMSISEKKPCFSIIINEKQQQKSR